MSVAETKSAETTELSDFDHPNNAILPLMGVRAKEGHSRRCDHYDT